MDISTQYNLLVTLFPDKVINKKDLSNAIQQFKKQAKPNKNDACQMLTDLYLKKEIDSRWIIKPHFDLDERRLNSLFWMSPDQVNAYGRYHDIVIIDTTSKTNQFDMLLMLIIVVDNNFKSLIVAAAVLEDETEVTFSWLLQELKNSCDVIPTALYFDADLASITAKVMNKIIKDKLNRSSCLTDVVKEVQKTFDQQSKKAILSECKNEIPTKGIPSIMDEYFPELDKILREYLTPQILQKQHDQMAQSLYYDTILIKDWLPLLDVSY
ncbi:unnamed protein product [Rhizophagus irregularis]|nr:unnamed protein product [Rhizophagus irregularis]